MNLLQNWAGNWAGEERIVATRWGPGGNALGVISARMELGGRILVQDYREERDGQPALQVHAVFVAEAEERFSLYWFDSYGFVPQQPAAGHWDGERLVFVRRSPRGQSRHIYTMPDARGYRFTLESSFDEGASWEPVLDADYGRAQTPG